ncbi:MAG: DUF4367 domain-containing protein [Candidatus Tectomicrobia bacterium]|nr:DUF4367 domain-containing protein [Candidatus Tectomicrobia bacterium]
MLERMAQAELSQVYAGEKVVADLTQPVPKFLHFRVIRLLPNLERREFLHTNNQPADVVVNDGNYLWHYQPLRGLVEKRKAPSLQQRRTLQLRTLDLIKENYAVKVQALEQPLDGRRADLLEFSSKLESARLLRRVWIDRETGLALRTEVYGLDARLTHLSYFTRINFSPAVYSETFELRVPNSTRMRTVEELSLSTLREISQEFERSQSVRVHRPSYLPPGFSIIRSQVQSVNSEKKVLLKFSDGLNTLLLYQTVLPSAPRPSNQPSRPIDIGGVAGHIFELGYVRALKWHRDGNYYTLVGNLPEEELVRTAASIQ